MFLYTERIACILCMHLGACRSFYAPNCINAPQKAKSESYENASSCILFFLHIHEWVLTENYYKKLHYHTDHN